MELEIHIRINCIPTFPLAFPNQMPFGHKKVTNSRNRDLFLSQTQSLINN